MQPAQILGTEQTGFAREWRALMCLRRKADACSFLSFLLKTSPILAAFAPSISAHTNRLTMMLARGNSQCEHSSTARSWLVAAVLGPGRRKCVFGIRNKQQPSGTQRSIVMDGKRCPTLLPWGCEHKYRMWDASPKPPVLSLQQKNRD